MRVRVRGSEKEMERWAERERERGTHRPTRATGSAGECRRTWSAEEDTLASGEAAKAPLATHARCTLSRLAVSVLCGH